MATVIGSDSARIFAINEFLGINESLDGDTQPGQEEPPKTEPPQENGTDFGPEGKPKE